METEKTPAELEAEKQALDSQTDEKPNEVVPPTEDVEKQEENPYKKQLEDLEAKHQEELKKKDEIISHKNRALDAEKKKKELSPEDLDARMRKAAEDVLIGQKLEQKINAMSDDASERELIKKILETRITRSGNIDEDLKAALAIANSDGIWKQREAVALEQRRESYLASFQPSSARGEMPSQATNPLARQAEELVRLMNPEAVKHVRKQFE